LLDSFNFTKKENIGTRLETGASRGPAMLNPMKVITLKNAAQMGT
jgi:hypothetical protein